MSAEDDSMLGPALFDTFAEEGEGGAPGADMSDQHGFYSGNVASIPFDGGDVGAGRPLTWDNLDAGIDLLDRSDLEEPAVLVSGIYAVTVVIESDTALTAGGGLMGVLHLDFHNLDAVNEDTFGTRADGRILRSLACTFYIPAGGTISVKVSNFDGAVDHDVRLREAVIQRIG